MQSLETRAETELRNLATDIDNASIEEVLTQSRFTLVKDTFGEWQIPGMEQPRLLPVRFYPGDPSSKITIIGTKLWTEINRPFEDARIASVVKATGADYFAVSTPGVWHGSLFNGLVPKQIKELTTGENSTADSTGLAMAQATSSAIEQLKQKLVIPRAYENGRQFVYDFPSQGASLGAGMLRHTPYDPSLILMREPADGMIGKFLSHGGDKNAEYIRINGELMDGRPDNGLEFVKKFSTYILGNSIYYPVGINRRSIEPDLQAAYNIGKLGGATIVFVSGEKSEVDPPERETDRTRRLSRNLGTATLQLIIGEATHAAFNDLRLNAGSIRYIIESVLN